MQTFEPILVDSCLYVGFNCYDNTSDVMIASSPWEHPLRDWDILLIGCLAEQNDLLRHQLLTTGLPTLQDWFISSNKALLDAPDVWQCFGHTMRFEHGSTSQAEVKDQASALHLGGSATYEHEAVHLL